MQNLHNIVDKKLKPWQRSNANLAVYPVMFEHIIVQSKNEIPYDSLSNLKSYWNEKVSCQGTIIHMKEMLKSVNLWNWEGL